jgi:hypothetical protein
VSRFALIALALLALSSSADAALVLRNGSFDDDPDLGGADETMVSPTGWYQHYTVDQSWSDFRFGNNGNGGWTNNGIVFGQNYLGPNFEPGPEDGYYYTSLGNYGGEVSATVNGVGYNRTNGNPAGSFVVSLFSTPAGSFTAADGTDVATVGRLLGTTTVDISSLTGTVARSQPFQLAVTFAGTGIAAGDEVWLQLNDGPDNGNLDNFDEPIIDNLTLTTVVPEPAAAGLLLAAAPLVLRRRRAA